MSGDHPFCTQNKKHMTLLHDQLSRTLQPGMRIPQPLALLFTWIENKKQFVDTANGRIGLLFPEDQLKTGWTETERPGGTRIEFFAEGNSYAKHWFGHGGPNVMHRVCVLAKTGADGSVAAFWLDDDGNQKIVHMGSGSGSLLTCVLTDDPIDFLRLLAIGYDEICWHDAWSRPPNAELSDGALFVHPNSEYQDWVRTTFSVAIPRTALEVVKHPSDMGDPNSPDPFCRWVEQNAA